MVLQQRNRLLAVLFGAALLTGCLFHTRNVTTRLSTAKLKNASLEEMVSWVNANSSKLQSLSANVDFSVSTGGEKKGKVTDYRTFSGYVLVRKPDMLRMIGLVPVVRNRLFDMVSNGASFELSIPAKNKFYVGSAQKPPVKRTDEPLANLRPQDIFDALLIRPIEGPPNEIAVMEQSTEMVKDPNTHKQAIQPDYVVVVIRKGEHGYYLSRRIVFSRTDLLPHEQWIYDPQGELVTYAHYENFAEHNGIMMPSLVEIQRPVEEYAITLNVTKLSTNIALRDDQFSLQRPPGSQLINVDQTTKTSAGNEPATALRHK
jgi:outer membrane lipoprotein-sorting protein